MSATASRLLLDLLEHEVVEAALLGGGEIPVDVEVRAIDGLPVEDGDRVTVGPDLDDLVLAELDRLAGELDEGGDVAAEEHLALADAEDQRRVAAGADDDVRVVGVDDNQRERADAARGTTARTASASEPSRCAQRRGPPGARRSRCRSR